MGKEVINLILKSVSVELCSDCVVLFLGSDAMVDVVLFEEVIRCHVATNNKYNQF